MGHPSSFLSTKSNSSKGTSCFSAVEIMTQVSDTLDDQEKREGDVTVVIVMIGEVIQ